MTIIRLETLGTRDAQHALLFRLFDHMQAAEPQVPVRPEVLGTIAALPDRIMAGEPLWAELGLWGIIFEGVRWNQKADGPHVGLSLLQVFGYLGEALKEHGPSEFSPARALMLIFAVLPEPPFRLAQEHSRGTVRDISDSRKILDRQNALIEIGDQLRDLDTAAEMASVAAAIMGRTLGVSRAGYATIDILTERFTVERDWTAPGERSLTGTHSLGQFGRLMPDLLAGHEIVIDDVREDDRTSSNLSAWEEYNVLAMMNVPVVEHGRLVALLFLHVSEVRHWATDKIAFIRNVADRIRAAIERVRAEQRQAMLNQELNHRLKNTLAMVQAIATQTMRTAKDVKSGAETLSSRLVALGSAQDVLLSGHREAAPMRALVLGALRLHDDPRQSRFRLKGPDIEVGSRAALSLALMLHEMATNAAKYGALSVRDGRVDITWTVTGSGDKATLHFTWRERGGPPVVFPQRRGLGSRLIERGLAGQIGGTVELLYEPEGVVCRVQAPLGAFQAESVHPERK